MEKGVLYKDFPSDFQYSSVDVSAKQSITYKNKHIFP